MCPSISAPCTEQANTAPGSTCCVPVGGLGEVPVRETPIGSTAGGDDTHGGARSNVEWRSARTSHSRSAMYAPVAPVRFVKLPPVAHRG